MRLFKMDVMEERKKKEHKNLQALHGGKKNRTREGAL